VVHRLSAADVAVLLSHESVSDAVKVDKPAEFRLAMHSDLAYVAGYAVVFLAVGENKFHVSDPLLDVLVYVVGQLFLCYFFTTLMVEKSIGSFITVG
jgi:hypothetical protein